MRVRGRVQPDLLGVGGVPVDGLKDERAAQVQFEGDKQNSNRISPHRVPHGASRLPTLHSSQNMSRRTRQGGLLRLNPDPERKAEPEQVRVRASQSGRGRGSGSGASASSDHIHPTIGFNPLRF